MREAQNEAASKVPSPHRPAQLLEAVRRSSNLVLEGCGWSNLDWDFIASDIVATGAGGERLPVSLLSDGIRNMIALVADLAHRTVRLNPQLGADAPQQTPGIVLIDEVDMHLHPAWQQTVLEQLRRAFGQVQFVVTTHSPQVLSTVDAESIRVIRHRDGLGILDTPKFQTRGVESADVLASIMDVDPIPSVPEAAWLSEYRALIEDARDGSDRGAELIARLVEHFGADHPVMLECARLARFQLAATATGPFSTAIRHVLTEP